MNEVPAEDIEAGPVIAPTIPSRLPDLPDNSSQKQHLQTSPLTPYQLVDNLHTN